MLKKLKQTSRQSNVSLGLLVLRVGASLSMIALHGYPKIMGWSESSTKFFDPLGVGPAASLALVIFAEIICSLLITFGWFTRLAAIPLIIAMSVATFGYHAADPLAVQEKGYMYIVIYLTLLLAGAGKYSVDGKSSR